MAVTLTWVRDHYDSIKDRYIDKDEVKQVIYDFNDGTITKEQMDAALDAWRNHVLLPAYDTPPGAITCNGATPHYSSGCALLKHYDADDDGVIDGQDIINATIARRSHIITNDEYDFVSSAHNAGSINAVCPGCYSSAPSPPPQVCTPGATRCYNGTTTETCKSDGSGWTRHTCQSGYECKNGACVKTAPGGTEVKTSSLIEGNHNIQVSLAGYDTLKAMIHVSPSDVKPNHRPAGSVAGSTHKHRENQRGYQN